MQTWFKDIDCELRPGAHPAAFKTTTVHSQLYISPTRAVIFSLSQIETEGSFA